MLHIGNTTISIETASAFLSLLAGLHIVMKRKDWTWKWLLSYTDVLLFISLNLGTLMQVFSCHHYSDVWCQYEINGHDLHIKQSSKQKRHVFMWARMNNESDKFWEYRVSFGNESQWKRKCTIAKEAGGNKSAQTHNLNAVEMQKCPHFQKIHDSQSRIIMDPNPWVSGFTMLMVIFTAFS